MTFGKHAHGKSRETLKAEVEAHWSEGRKISQNLDLDRCRKVDIENELTAIKETLAGRRERKVTENTRPYDTY